LSKGSGKRMVAIGRFSSPHGVRGEVKFRPFEGVDDFIWDEVFVRQDDREPRLEVVGVRGHTGSFLLTIRGYDQREDAACLKGLEALVPESSLPDLEEGEFYHKDLVGLPARTDDGRELGLVKKVFPAGAGSDVMEINGPFGEVLVPVTEETILEVNLESEYVLVHMPEGLLNEGD